MPNYNKLIPSLLEHGLEALPRYCHLTPGRFDQITTSYAALKRRTWMHIKKKRGRTAINVAWVRFRPRNFFPGCYGLPLLLKNKIWFDSVSDRMCLGRQRKNSMYDSRLCIFEPQTLSEKWSKTNRSEMYSLRGVHLTPPRVNYTLACLIVKCTDFARGNFTLFTE